MARLLITHVSLLSISFRQTKLLHSRLLLVSLMYRYMCDRCSDPKLRYDLGFLPSPHFFPIFHFVLNNPGSRVFHDCRSLLPLHHWSSSEQNLGCSSYVGRVFLTCSFSCSRWHYQINLVLHPVLVSGFLAHQMWLEMLLGVRLGWFSQGYDSTDRYTYRILSHFFPLI